MTTTLLQLRNDCKAQSDMSGSTGPDGFIPDGEWNQYINGSLAEFTELVVRSNSSFYLTSSQFSVAGSANTAPLPSDFWVMKGLERSFDGSSQPGSWYDVHRMPWEERNYGNTAFTVLWGQPWARYALQGTNVFLAPPTAAAGLYQIWYYPKAPVLVNDSDTFDDQRYWYEYVVVDVAIKAKSKQEDDVSVLMARKQALTDRIELMAADRDFSEPDVIGRRGNGYGNRFGGGWGGGGWW